MRHRGNNEEGADYDDEDDGIENEFEDAYEALMYQ
jgi:hypothetical protein